MTGLLCLLLLGQLETRTFVVTAYCPCARCTYGARVTASGKPVSYNGGRFVAADPALPFGTRVRVPGYSPGFVEVQDRGGAIKGNRLDVYYPTHRQALRFGRRRLRVEIERKQ